ncbi:MAG: GPW/gp25 family protein [Actinomycetota bacterium]|jgi:hypothetical protein|nr:GPW/gp25 family protein [Actinomycetota bacterium]MDG1488989.1 GPW/gp25 family protein [Actinomycetota bacterium]MDG2122031.1 GPW/gp25 family protein [Actinomycetota bacterium]
MSETDFLGRGIDFPFVIDAKGSFGFAEGVISVEKSILMILSTAPGERAFRPNFGCLIWELLYESITPSLFGRMEMYVRQALEMWEPRIDLEQVSTIDGSEFGTVEIEIVYKVKDTNDRRNLVFPFYVIPAEGEERGLS